MDIQRIVIKPRYARFAFVLHYNTQTITCKMYRLGPSWVINDKSGISTEIQKSFKEFLLFGNKFKVAYAMFFLAEI